jgi:nucleotide-binding universal stress UspA family protein
MTVVVGYIPHRGGRGALDLGLQLAHARGEAMAVVTVIPRQWSTPSMAKIDAEYAEYARQVGEEAEQQARDYLRDTSVEVETTYRATTGRSVSSALVETAQELGGSTLVIGSSADGPEGRIVTGATAEKLLHSAHVPLAISPRGYRSVAAAGFTRLTCAFSDSDSSVRTVARAAELAKQLGVPMRVASFGVRHATMYPPEVGLTAEDSVLDSWADQAAEAQRRLVADGVIDGAVPCVIGTGSGWVESVGSIDWQRGELLAIGSSAAGPLARVFLGSRAAKLIRAAPVPVVMLPS